MVFSQYHPSLCLWLRWKLLYICFHYLYGTIILCLPRIHRLFSLPGNLSVLMSMSYVWYFQRQRPMHFSGLEGWIFTFSIHLFFYLQLQTALKTHGVPWNTSLPIHSRVSLIFHPCGTVLCLYSKLRSCINSALPPIEKTSSPFIFWSSVFHVFICSKNLAPQLIHYKFLHGVYLTLH